MQKQLSYIIKGMNRDVSISKLTNEFSYENMNIRLTATDDSTTMSIVNEKGNKRIILSNPIQGIVLGYCVVGNYIVLFTKLDSTDFIYRISKNEDNTYTNITLFQGSAGFSLLHPIETIGMYETTNIQKVYWIDGVNQIRMINIISEFTSDVNRFNFVQDLELEESLYVTRINSGGGMFSPGVIQYAFNYYNSYGQESNIFNTSDIHYISYSDRGGTAEDTCNCSFNIKLSNIDTSFDFLRIYSIHRTSLDATPVVKIIKDVNIDSANIEYTDTGTTGYTIDPASLLFKGGEDIVPYSICHKDNTLFLGNYKLSRPTIPTEIKEELKLLSINFDNKEFINNSPSKSHYNYTNQLNNSNRSITTLKRGETYRFGIQFQYKTGRWSEAVFIKDTVVSGNILSENENIALIKAYSTLTESIVTRLNSDFKRCRPLIVHPEFNDRTILMQGMICPTIYNVGDRVKNSPYVQASWFARPILPYDENTSITDGGIDSPKGVVSNNPFKIDNDIIDTTSKGAWVQYKNNRSVFNSNNYGGEIQNIKTNNDAYQEYLFDSSFLVDTSFVTLHSPELEFSDIDMDLKDMGAKFRIVGYINLTSSVSDKFINTSRPTIKDSQGLLDFKITNFNYSKHGFKIQCASPIWKDKQVSSDGTSATIDTDYIIYPWHRNTSLNNSNNEYSEFISSTLEKKIISNLRYSAYNDWVSPNILEISDIQMFNSNEVTMLKVGDKNYYGNIDKISVEDNYPINTINEDKNIVKLDSNYIDYTNDPINIKYKSTPHVIIELFNDGTNFNILPSLNSNNRTEETDVIPFWSNPNITGTNSKLVPTEMIVPFPDNTVFLDYWDERPHLGHSIEYEGLLSYSSIDNKIYEFRETIDPETSGLPEGYFNWVSIGLATANSYYHYDGTLYTLQTSSGVDSFRVSYLQDNINIDTPYGGLFLGEIYRPNVVNRFGGDSEAAINDSNWIPAGPIVKLTNGNTIQYLEGDTYYQRYDCLKTYPFTQEDTNSIVDIVSFMCETRVNIEGRTDRNRGNTNNTTVSPLNFNLFNTVYNQKNNFFSYKGLDNSKLSESYFPTSITWTSEKTIGADIDTWTNISLTTDLLLDGDKGAINALKIFNNEILAFQDTGISNVLFNSRVQIPVSDGVPIEIGNSYKVSGKRYISENVGCLNKWSIVNTSSGLYFIDNTTKSIYSLQQGLVDVSSQLGFRSFIQNNNSVETWNPVSFDNFISYYDTINKEIYFVNKNYCLCYSELLQQFTSFYSYKNTPAMFNYKDKLLSYKNNYLWEHWEGNYNEYYGKFEPFYINYKINPNPITDKIFDSLEFRSDSFENGFVSKKTFDTLEVWNEYQHGKSILASVVGHPSKLKKKFRIWKASIPRDSKNGRDRIRNPWIHLKLSYNYENYLKTVLHDIKIIYTE